jgi:ferrochelatase
MLEVAEHYQHFGGVSPINQQNQDLIHALQPALRNAGIDWPIYWGNRNWHPFLPDTLQKMRKDGIRHGLAFFTSMFSSYSGCRQYRENLQAAADEVGADSPVIEKLRFGFNHPGFISASADRIQSAIDETPEELNKTTNGLRTAPILFTAHSIPVSMANQCNYVKQLMESARLVAEQLGRKDWELVFQSRSGPPQQPWLEPDVVSRIEQLHKERQISAVIVAPLGFISDHIEVLYDLDTEVAQRCQELGVHLCRVKTVGTHPRFVEMIVDLVQERMSGRSDRQALGTLGAWHDLCPVDCCLPR